MHKLNFQYYHTERLIIFIVAIAIVFGGLATYIHHILSPGSGMFGMVIFVTDSFTVPFFISVTFFMINKYWWKKRIFKWLINVPDLNGRYAGKLKSSYIENGKEKVIDCVMEIKQTASNIHISAFFGDITKGVESSSSRSTSETLKHQNNGFFTLYYIFANETGEPSEALNNHTGAGKFEIYPDLKKLKGNYYNIVKNTGSIEVNFESAQLLNRLKP